jgi:hypothetical protein
MSAERFGEIKKGSRELRLPFFLNAIRLNAGLERVLKPELDLSVPVDGRRDVGKVRAQQIVAIHAAIREKVGVIESVEKFRADRKRLPLQEFKRALHGSVVEHLAGAKERVTAQVAVGAKSIGIGGLNDVAESGSWRRNAGWSAV